MIYPVYNNLVGRKKSMKILIKYQNIVKKNFFLYKIKILLEIAIL